MNTAESIVDLIRSENVLRLMELITNRMEAYCLNNITFQIITPGPDDSTDFFSSAITKSMLPNTVNTNIYSTQHIQYGFTTKSIEYNERAGKSSSTFSNACDIFRNGLLACCYKLTHNKNINETSFENIYDATSKYSKYMFSGEFNSHVFHCVLYDNITKTLQYEVIGECVELNINCKMFLHNDLLPNDIIECLPYDTQQIDIDITKRIIARLFSESLSCSIVTVCLYWITQKDVLDNVPTHFDFFTSEQLFECLLPKLSEMSCECLSLTVPRMIDAERKLFAVYFDSSVPTFIKDLCRRKCRCFIMKNNRGKTYDNMTSDGTPPVEYYLPSL